MHFRLFGGFEVIDGDTRVDSLSPKQRLVLAVLLLELDRVVSVDRLVDVLWGDEADAGVGTLHSYISRVRNVLEPGRPARAAPTVLLTQPPGYRLRVARSDVDVFRFEDGVAAGRERFRTGDHRGAVVAMREALAAWSGPLLPESESEPFVIAHATRLGGVRLSALETAADAHLHLGEHVEVVALLEADGQDHPTRERLQFLLALAQYRAGRQTDALRTIDRCRRALVEQSGLSLGSELRHLEVSILDQDPELMATIADDSTESAPVSPMVAAPTISGPAIVGRATELALLDDAITAALAGHGAIATIIGEPGVGKTRLAEAVAERAAARGMVTVWARCPENRSAPSFWPLTQLGEQLRAAGFTDLAVRELDRRGGDVGVTERFELYRAVLGAVASIDRPVLFVIDDLQWADPDSLRLIEHIASDLRTTRTLLVSTARPIDDAAQPAFVDCLAEVARVHDATVVSLGRLNAGDIVEWIAARHDVGATLEIAELVHERTGGNALFVKEVIELLASEGRLATVESARAARAIPPGVKSVVRRRVSRLPQTAQTILPVAAVLGRSLDLEVVAAACATDTPSLLAALEPAVAAGVLIASDRGLAFSHVVVADALADEVNAVRRATIHATAARALAASAGTDFGVQASWIAHHAFEGIMAGSGELAIAAGTRAAELAADQLAHEDAAAHWARVADSVARCRPNDLAARIDAQIAQARALLRADMVVAAKAPIVSAIDTAAVAGLHDRMATAALLVNHEHVWANEPYGVVDVALVRALERTLAETDGDAPDRPLLLGALAAELAFADRGRHLAACAAAEEAARRSSSPTTLATVLNAITVPCRPDQRDDRARWATEILELAEAHELAPDQRFAAHYHHTETFVERGDFAAADAELLLARRLIEPIPSDRLRSQLYGFESALALARGRYGDAERLMEESHDLHRRGRRYDADSLQLSNVAALALDRGGLEELLPFAVSTARTSAYGRTVAEVVAFAMLELGRSDIAAQLIEPYDASSAFPDDYMTLCCMTAALHVRVELDRDDAAAAIADRLGSFGNRWAGAGTTPLSMGPTGVALAREAAGRDDALAATWFADSITMLEANGARPWLARTLVHQARFQFDTGDAAAANESIERATEIADRFGLAYVARRIDQFVC